jgi:hypothetical protein
MFQTQIRAGFSSGTSRFDRPNCLLCFGNANTGKVLTLTSETAAPADLDALLELVQDEMTFGTFLHALAVDFETDRTLMEADPKRYAYSAGPLGWEVGTISDFLYGAAAEAGRRAPLRPPVADNPWRRCAEMLLISKIME